MKCPIDNNDLVMTERQGVEIDYCPKCRGVWLDRGELDKIIDRSVTAGPSRPEPRPTEVTSTRDSRELSTGGYDKDDARSGQPPKKKKRGSFLEDLFDF